MGTNRQRLRMAAIVTLAGVMTAVFLPSLVAPQGMGELGMPYLSPGPGHVLGTNDIGQDLLSELIFGAQASLTVGFLSALIATLLGSALGSLAGYFRGTTDALLMGLADMFLAIPGLPLVIILAALLGPGIGNIVFVISLLSWAPTARIIRSRVLSLREAAFVLNARCLGGGHFYLIFKHILPNTADLILAKAVLAIAAGMMAEAGLSFLGLGDPVSKSWGGMIHDAFSCGALTNGAYWWYGPPIFCLALFVLIFSVISNFLLHATQNPGMSEKNYYGIKADSEPSLCKENLDRSSWPSIIEIRDFSLSFPQPGGNLVQAIDGLSMSVRAGEKVAVLGLSGSGKSLLLLSLLGIRIPGGQCSGQVFFQGMNIAEMTCFELMNLRKENMAYVPQGTGNALNPLMRIGKQIEERMPLGKETDKGNTVLDLLAKAGLDRPRETAANFPHRLSGGMKEKVLAAMALASQAGTILADEPTKALDSTSSSIVTAAYASMRERALIAVTHDLEFARAIADRILVMHQGRIVEDAPVGDFFAGPMHPFAQALFQSVPKEKWNPGSFKMGQNPPAPSSSGACSFFNECPQAFNQCNYRPPLAQIGDRHIRCWLHASKSD